MKTKRKINDLVTPKDCPELESKVERITKDIAGEPLYVLENGTFFTEDELEPAIKPIS